MLRAMGFTTSGRILTIMDPRQVSERFRLREFVVEIADNPKYPQSVLFQVSGDRCEMLDDFHQGDNVEIEFSLRGREWKSPKGETRYFNSLDVWTVRQASDQASPGMPEDAPPPDDEHIPF